MIDQKTIDKAVRQHDLEYRKARTTDAIRSVQKQLEEVADSLCRQAERDFGCAPLRVSSFRVTEKKPRAFYQAAEEATRILIHKSYLRDKSIKDLKPVLFAEVRERLKLEDGVISSEESYWKTPFNDIQRKEVHGMLQRNGYEPTKAVDRLSQVLVLLRAGKPAPASNERPTGGMTKQGPVSFESRKHVHYLGERYLIRWKSKQPYLRMDGASEYNLFALLKGVGLDQATVELWMDNAEREAVKRRERAEAEAQLVADTVRLEDTVGALFDTSAPPPRPSEDEDSGDQWPRFDVVGGTVDA